ncbi:MAG TPA: spermine/spermidine synthase [bacterium]|nr:spermine/spermidine synthase [bacterium]
MSESDPVPSGREIIARVTTTTGDWQLQRRAGHYEIICNGVFLMASYNRESDRQLARLALNRVRRDDLTVLIGGLGIGYTLQAALEDPRIRWVEVVEVEPLVLEWHRRFFAPLCGHPLDDVRTRVIVSDLMDVPLSTRSFGAILLDTDNGPDWLVTPDNARIYAPDAAERFLNALMPGGVLAFWSADRVSEFAAMLAGVAGRVEEVEVTDEIAPGRSGSAWIYLARAQA